MAAAPLGTLVRHIQMLAVGAGVQQWTDRQLLDDFLARRNEAAFTALVSRHGPMVLRVCRRVLYHEQDAEDAFQATFLVLARNFRSIRKRDTLANWLHGVAYRTAMKAKRSAARRRNHEASVRAMAPQPAASPTWDDVKAVLDEEVQRLPRCFREAFVLCVLEGKSGPEAAAELGCKEGTVKSRVSRARRQLQQRFARRGITLSALLAALSVAEGAGRAALPVTLAHAAAQSGLLIAAGESAAGVISSHVAALAAGVTRTMFLTKAKIAVFLLSAVSLVATGAGVLTRQALATKGQETTPATSEQPRSEKRPGSPKSADTSDKNSLTFGGRVLDPDGNPVEGAKLLLLYGLSLRVPERKISATSGAEGRFQFMVSKTPVDDFRWESPMEYFCVMAAAEGYGFAVAPLAKPEEAAAVTLRLVKDVPIQGRVLNLEGKPIAGVRVRINDLEPLNSPQLYTPKKGDLTAWLAALKAYKEDVWDVERTYLTGLYSPAFDLLFPPVTTGADGRFQMRGIGRERLAHLRLEGPTIATQIVNVMTRPGGKIHLPLSKGYPKGQSATYHGAAFEVLAAPTKPVVGVVRDKDTGKPLAGVTVEPSKITNPFRIANYDAGLIRTTTDKAGRYRLVGLPKGEDNQLMAAAKDLPYLHAVQTVENTPGLEPVTVDFPLKCGIWVKGRVTEKTTGKPLSGGVAYYCFSDNPNKKELPLVFGGTGGPTREDGSFQLVAVPGRGVIAVQVAHNNRYLSGVGADQIKGPRRDTGIECLDTYPVPCQIYNMNTLVEIDPKPGDESVTCDLTVYPGRTLTGTVLGPDGKPLAGARRCGWDAPLPGTDFTVWGLRPNKPYQRQVLLFVHDDKKLAGFLVVQGDEKEPLTVRLEPWGTLTGRLLTPRGSPLTGAWVSCSPAPDVQPDKNGRFRIEGLIPGWKHNLYVSKEGLSLDIAAPSPKDVTIKAAETKDLGDLQVIPPE